MKLNQLFCNNAVLQANQPVFVFGTGKGSCFVEIDNLSKKEVFTEENWCIELPSHDYGGPYEMRVILDGEEQILSEIYFGDVFLLAGQSNNQVKLFETKTPKEEYQGNDRLRLFTLERPEDGEFFFPSDGWVCAKEDNVDKWPAIGYLTGNIHSKNTDRAVGLIACYQGASMIQSWMPKGILVNTELDIASEETSGEQRVKEYLRWNHDGFLYKKMFLPIVPFGIKAVIWYQGESNTDTPDNTKEIHYGLLKLLISTWRTDLKNENLHFFIIQLPDYIYGNPEGWKAVQMAQVEAAQNTQNAYCIECSDICEDNHIHPATKLPLAQRIADITKNI